MCIMAKTEAAMAVGVSGRSSASSARQPAGCAARSVPMESIMVVRHGCCSGLASTSHDVQNDAAVRVAAPSAARTVRAAVAAAAASSVEPFCGTRSSWRSVAATVAAMAWQIRVAAVGAACRGAGDAGATAHTSVVLTPPAALRASSPGNE